MKSVCRLKNSNPRTFNTPCIFKISIFEYSYREDRELVQTPFFFKCVKPSRFWVESIWPEFYSTFFNNDAELWECVNSINKYGGAFTFYYYMLWVNIIIIITIKCVRQCAVLLVFARRWIAPDVKMMTLSVCTRIIYTLNTMKRLFFSFQFQLIVFLSSIQSHCLSVSGIFSVSFAWMIRTRSTNWFNEVNHLEMLPKIEVSVDVAALHFRLSAVKWFRELVAVILAMHHRMLGIHSHLKIKWRCWWWHI